MSGFHLAQLNVARMKYPLHSPEMAQFVALLDPINALADQSPGFVWRHVEEGKNDATEIRPYDDPMVIVNYSVWEDRDTLWDFVYRSRHLELLRRRREWFTSIARLDQVLFWVPAGTIPTLEEGMRRLALVRENGPSPEAFTFRAFFEPELEPSA